MARSRDKKLIQAAAEQGAKEIVVREGERTIIIRFENTDAKSDSDVNEWDIVKNYDPNKKRST